MKRRNLMKTLLVATLVCASAALAGEGSAVKGNPKSKVYHKPACQHYNAKGSTQEFKSEAEAKKAGYKACKQCCTPKGEKQAADKKK